jgi:hypothetical protein
MLIAMNSRKLKRMTGVNFSEVQQLFSQLLQETDGKLPNQKIELNPNDLKKTIQKTWALIQHEMSGEPTPVKTKPQVNIHSHQKR